MPRPFCVGGSSLTSLRAGGADTRADGRMGRAGGRAQWQCRGCLARALCFGAVIEARRQREADSERTERRGEPGCRCGCGCGCCCVPDGRRRRLRIKGGRAPWAGRHPGLASSSRRTTTTTTSGIRTKPNLDFGPPVLCSASSALPSSSSSGPSVSRSGRLRLSLAWPCPSA